MGPAHYTLKAVIYSVTTCSCWMPLIVDGLWLPHCWCFWMQKVFFKRVSRWFWHLPALHQNMLNLDCSTELGPQVNNKQKTESLVAPCLQILQIHISFLQRLMSWHQWVELKRDDTCCAWEGCQAPKLRWYLLPHFFLKKKQKLPNWFQSHIDNYFIKDKTHLFLSQNTNWLNRILNFYFINRHILATKCRKTQETFFFLQFHTSKEANKFQCSAILG